LPPSPTRASRRPWRPRRLHRHDILGAFSYFDFLKPYLFTSHIDAWQNLFHQPIDWHPIWNGILTFAIYIGGLSLAAWYVFRRKDILV